MTAEEFWKDDPQLFVSYRTFYINKKQNEFKENDYKSWLQGLYVYDGNSKIIRGLMSLLINMFSKSKDKEKIGTYPEKPYFSLNNDKEDKVKSKKEQDYEDYENTLAYYASFKKRAIERMLSRSRKEKNE